MANLTDTTYAEGDRPGFELFPKLPIELRLKIFRIAAEEPRIIELGYDHVKGRVVQQQPMPPLFRTCREAREEWLRGQRSLLCDKVNNQRAFMQRWRMPSLVEQRRDYRGNALQGHGFAPGNTVENQKVFMNFEADALYLPRGYEIPNN